jgi:hypothetical protein
MTTTTSTNVSLDDVTMLRRIKKHVANCDCCRESLTKEDGSGEPNQTIQPNRGHTTDKTLRSYAKDLNL